MATESIVSIGTRTLVTFIYTEQKLIRTAGEGYSQKALSVGLQPGHMSLEVLIRNRNIGIAGYGHSQKALSVQGHRTSKY